MQIFSGMGEKTEGEELTPEDILPPSNPEGKDTEKNARREVALSALAGKVKERYETSRFARSEQEAIWLNAFRMWRGLHSPEQVTRIQELRARNPYASAVFIKATTTKCTVAMGQIGEVIFQNDEIPIAIEPTKVPEGIAESIVLAEDTPGIADVYGFPGDGRNIEPGATSQSLLGGLYQKMRQGLGKLSVFEGIAADHQTQKQVNPADEAAYNMQKAIHDQLQAGDFQMEIRKAIWDMVVYGTGIMEGPYTYTQTTHYWEPQEDGSRNYSPRVIEIPRYYQVSVWDLYPDPNGLSVKDCEWIVRRRIMSRSQISGLRRIEGFDQKAIDRLLLQQPNRVVQYWEQVLREMNNLPLNDRYEVLEYWGYLEAEDIQEFDEFKNELLEGTDQFQVNVWVSGGEVLRVIINPFVPQRLPYYATPYQENPNGVFGVGIPENCNDSQELVNSHYRMMIDNLALAGSCVLEVDTNNLETGQDMKIYPGKIFYKQAGAPGQSVYSISFNNTAQSHMMAMDKARQQMDEASNLFSQSYGNSNVMGSNRTASGMSMLMSAAASSIKQVVRNMDEYMFKPIGESAYFWNMRFNEDIEVVGDMNVVARGTAAIMQREVRSQRLIQLQQAANSNPITAARLNNDYILEELAKSLDLDPDKALNDDETFFKIMQNMQQMQGQAPQAGMEQAPGMESAAGNPAAMSTGSVPQPGEPGFSANTGQ